MSGLVLALLEDCHNGEQVKTCLQDCGYEVLIVMSIAHAMSILSTQKIDLVVSDVHLENGGNVFDFLGQVKKGLKTSKIPFIFYSFQPTPAAKYLADGVRIAARYLGAVKYIEMEKFSAVEFERNIKDMLSDARSKVDKGGEDSLKAKAMDVS